MPSIEDRLTEVETAIKSLRRWVLDGPEDDSMPNGRGPTVKELHERLTELEDRFPDPKKAKKAKT